MNDLHDVYWLRRACYCPAPTLVFFLAFACGYAAALGLG